MKFYNALLDDFYQTADLDEDIEKHSELNQKLFDGKKLKPEVIEKINQIVDLFLADLKEDGIKIDVEDIILVGSNVSYNYTKDSDLDIHIVANISNLHCPDNLYPLLYGAYKSLFNKKLDIDFYGIPVEIYVETDRTPLRSNGIYSVKDNNWIKFPKQEDIPDIDEAEIEKLLEPFEKRYNKIIKNPSIDAINKWITDIYDLRQKGMANDGEYSTENLVFKSARNKGYLDELKDLKNKELSKELSLESFNTIDEQVTGKDLNNYRIKLQQLTGHYGLVFNNGNFVINNVSKADADYIVGRLSREKFVVECHKVPSGKWDFNHIDPLTHLPKQYYTINGKLDIN